MQNRQPGLRERVDATIERRLGDPEFSVDVLASELGMSRSHLHRRLKRLGSEPPGRMIRHARLARAADLLVTTERPIAEIAHLVGYVDPAHFTRSFKRKFGRTPTAHRARRDRTHR